MIMDPTIEKLFDAYGESVLKELNNFPHGELVDLLNALPIEERRRIHIYDQVSHYYYQWSAAAFAAGLHLGLSFLNNDIRRFRPEKA